MGLEIYQFEWEMWSIDPFRRAVELCDIVLTDSIHPLGLNFHIQSRFHDAGCCSDQSVVCFEFLKMQG
jgi:hypothetical protein